jgi:hypothetical protein
MINQIKILLIVLGLCLAPVSVYSFMVGREELRINFTEPQDADAKASWSDTNRLTVTTNGVGWDGEATASRDCWIQTKPVAVGPAWRPPTAVDLSVGLDPEPKPVALKNGQTHKPAYPRVFARYSPDCKHWSSWNELKRGGTDPATVYTGSIGIPKREQAGLWAFRQEYYKLDVPWPDDTEAFVEWLLKREPDFFATSLPFIGYVEFLIEGSFYGGQRVRSLYANISWTVSGLHQPPKDNSVKPDMSSKWRLKGR